MDPSKSTCIIVRIAVGVKFQSVATALQEGLVEMVGGLTGGGGVIGEGDGRNGVVTEQIGGIKIGGNRDHVLVKISVLLTAIFCFGREAVLDVTYGSLFKPSFRNAHPTGDSRLKGGGKRFISLLDVSPRLVFKKKHHPRLVV